MRDFNQLNLITKKKRKLFCIFSFFQKKNRPFKSATLDVPLKVLNLGQSLVGGRIALLGIFTRHNITLESERTQKKKRKCSFCRQLLAQSQDSQAASVLDDIDCVCVYNDAHIHADRQNGPFKKKKKKEKKEPTIHCITRLGNINIATGTCVYT